MSAREAILAEIREANGGATTLEIANAAWVSIDRGYVTSLEGCSGWERFEDRLLDYDAEVKHCSEQTLTGAVLATLSTLGIQRLAIPSGLCDVDLEALTRNDVHLVPGDTASASELDVVDAVLTGSTLGIVETGTIVLQNVPGQGARILSLLPDVHLCIVRKKHMVNTVPEAIRLLETTADLPTTFVSGPSATADIEMTRIKGVHGPRYLHVFLVS